MYRNILVPVDLTHEEVANRILTLAKRLSASGARVTVIHVLPDIPSYVDTYVPHDVREARAKEQREILERMVAAAGLKADVRIAYGPPHNRILDVLDEVAPDLVIIGSHRPGLSDYFLGSTAARVVRHAQCSVLVDR
ncbi:universal stress protein [Halovulum dunhuangense]|uniref:Universal stress protein n=1 Tax=Halovulum dunhuangense TaxID=1505036 RepID=A0A849L2W3_9RHOB|nr:universal stress protein [Halovulum dunhuangense]NNU80574.1 universal stress protein [Halovulum dunhuangense]